MHFVLVVSDTVKSEHLFIIVEGINTAELWYYDASYPAPVFLISLNLKI